MFEETISFHLISTQADKADFKFYLQDYNFNVDDFRETNKNSTTYATLRDEFLWKTKSKSEITDLLRQRFLISTKMADLVTTYWNNTYVLQKVRRKGRRKKKPTSLYKVSRRREKKVPN